MAMRIFLICICLFGGFRDFVHIYLFKFVLGECSHPGCTSKVLDYSILSTNNEVAMPMCDTV